MRDTAQQIVKSCPVLLHHDSREGTENPAALGSSPIALDLLIKEPHLIKTGLVDIWGYPAASQVGQVQSAGEGNEAGCHLQDGQ